MLTERANSNILWIGESHDNRDIFLYQAGALVDTDTLTHLRPESDLSDESKERLRQYGALF